MTNALLSQYRSLKNELVAIQGKYPQRMERVQREISEIEVFLGSIEREDIRQIMYYRYEQWLSWKIVSKIVHGVLSMDSAVRKAAANYLQRRAK